MRSPVTLRLAILSLTAFWLSACATTNSPDLQASLKPDPAKSEQIARQAQMRFDAGNLLEADGYAKVALALDAHNTTALRIAAKLALSNHRPNDAIRHYSRLRLQESDAEIEGLLGLAYLRANNPEEAKVFLMSALATDPTRWREALALGTIERDFQNFEAALDLLRLAEQYTDRPEIVAREIGRVQTRNGQYAEALLAYERANASPSGPFKLDIDHRLALAHTGRMDIALDGADGATQSQIYSDLARDAIRRSNKVEAVALLKRARLATPRHDSDIEELMAKALQLSG